MNKKEAKTDNTAKKSAISNLKQLKQIFNKILLRYFNYIAILVVIIIFSAAYFYVLKPRYNRIFTAIKETEIAQNEELDDLNNYNNKLERYIRSYENIKTSDIAKLAKVLPPGSDKDQLFTYFPELIEKQGLILKSLSISDPETPKNSAAPAALGGLGVGIINIKADIVGVNYETLKRLLSTLENNIRLMDVDNLNWNPSGSSVSLDIQTYYLK